jgi:uncharacterized protein (TIGR03086 family)
MDPIEMIEKASGACLKAVQGIKKDQLSSPTPCAEFDISGLLGHIISGTTMMTEAAATGKASGTTVEIGDDPAKTLGAARDQLLAAWKAPGVLEKTLTLPFGAMPGQMVAGILFMEQIVHAWDVLKATGQKIDIDPALAEAALEQLKPMGPMLRSPGVFGPEITIAAEAPVVDRLIAFTGRQP